MYLEIGAWSRDCTSVYVYDKDGNELLEYDGYVPSGIGIGGGDEVSLRINMETGQIEGWKPITLEQVKEAISNG